MEVFLFSAPLAVPPANRPAARLSAKSAEFVAHGGGGFAKAVNTATAGVDSVDHPSVSRGDDSAGKTKSTRAGKSAETIGNHGAVARSSQRLPAPTPPQPVLSRDSAAAPVVGTVVQPEPLVVADSRVSGLQSATEIDAGAPSLTPSLQPAPTTGTNDPIAGMASSLANIQLGPRCDSTQSFAEIVPQDACSSTKPLAEAWSGCGAFDHSVRAGEVSAWQTRLPKGPVAASANISHEVLREPAVPPLEQSFDREHADSMPAKLVNLSENWPLPAAGPSFAVEHPELRETLFHKANHGEETNSASASAAGHQASLSSNAAKLSAAGTSATLTNSSGSAEEGIAALETQSSPTADGSRDGFSQPEQSPMGAAESQNKPTTNKSETAAFMLPGLHLHESNPSATSGRNVSAGSTDKAQLPADEPEWQDSLWNPDRAGNTATLSEQNVHGDLRVVLQTDKLGNVELRARISGDQFGASITVEKKDAHAVLATELPALQQTLSEKQFRVAELSLLHGSLNAPTEDSQRSFSQPPGSQPKPRLTQWRADALAASVVLTRLENLGIFDSTGRLSVHA